MLKYYLKIIFEPTSFLFASIFSLLIVTCSFYIYMIIYFFNHSFIDSVIPSASQSVIFLF